MIVNNNKDIKAAFREALKENKISASAAARAAGLSPQALNNRFLRDNISITELCRIAAASGLSVRLEFFRPATAADPDATRAKNSTHGE